MDLIRPTKVAEKKTSLTNTLVAAPSTSCERFLVLFESNCNLVGVSKILSRLEGKKGFPAGESTLEG